MNVPFSSSLLLPIAAIMMLGSAAMATPAAPPNARYGSLLQQHLNHHGEPPWQGQERVTLTLRTHQVLTTTERASLEGLGLTFQRVDGLLAHVGPFYTVKIDTSALAVLKEHPLVRRLMAPAPPMLLAQDADTEEISIHDEYFGAVIGQSHAYAAHGLRDADGRALTGEGITFCNIDSGIDVFHPLLFHPDAGARDWVDVDDDGVLTPGIDGLDLDGDGELADNEVLLQLGGGIQDPMTGHMTDAQPFIPRRHWLYIDTNRSGWREYGTEDGYTENHPAYGEAIFLPDDVDANGVIESGERIFQLGTSKIKGIYRRGTDEILLRGVNLVDAPTEGDLVHATGTSTVLVGGTPGMTELVGVAPNADLLILDRANRIEQDKPEDGFSVAPGTFHDTAPLVSAVAWAKSQGARFFMHEYGSPMWSYMDGSDDWEQLLDTLTNEGYAQLTANHNFAGSRAFAASTLTPDQLKEIRFSAGSSQDSTEPNGFIAATLRWREGRLSDLEATLVAPGGTEEYPLAGSLVSNEAIKITSNRATSERGTHALNVAVVSQKFGAEVPLGTWKIRVINHGDETLKLHTRVTDVTGYGYLVPMLGSSVTDEGTLAWPATADTAISVGAIATRAGLRKDTIGALTSYSGRGPRIDGEMGVDIAAPTDSIAGLSQRGMGLGSYFHFGGTSGALPQVAGAVALLLQAEPLLNPEQIRARLASSATVDSSVGSAPNNEWGHGKLDTYRLLTAREAPRHSAPVAAGTATGAPVAQPCSLDASGSQDPDGDALRYRWDFDYDGVWDEESTQPTTSTSFASAGTHWVKLEVEDSHGITGRCLIPVNVSAAAVDPTTTPEGNTPDGVLPGSDGASLPTGAANEESDGGCQSALINSTRGGTWLLMGMLTMAWSLRLRRNHRRRQWC